MLLSVLDLAPCPFSPGPNMSVTLIPGLDPFVVELGSLLGGGGGVRPLFSSVGGST